MFNYQQIGGDTSTNKTTNYFILKPNGCELGTAYDSLGQTFLADAATPTLSLGTAYQYSISKRGQLLTVAINGMQVFDATYTGLYDQEGIIGLYCEDAAVQVSSVDLTTHDSSGCAQSISSWLSLLLNT
jgi:hypothetical protein